MYWTSVLVLILVITCGCLQPAPATITPVQSPTEPVTLPTSVTTIMNMQKQVNFTVTESKTMVNVTYEGGPDAADLQSINIRIMNQDGTQFPRTIDNPVIGVPYLFTYRGNANAKYVNIVGTFTNGYQQTVLMYYM
ncbi:MAG: hypothetical protein PHT99_05325 [Methanoregula sp.]|nr:hypothetical protein [Methanoregula sp.]